MHLNANVVDSLALPEFKESGLDKCFLHLM